jgi:HEAT repeat protein
MSSSQPQKPKILVEHVQGDPAQLPEGIVYAPSRGADAPARVSRQAQVIDDPEQVAQCRALYEQELDQLFASALITVREGGWLYLEHKGALTARRDRAVSALRPIMSGKQKASPTARVRAASALLALGERDGEAFLFDALTSRSAGLRAAAFKTLREHDCKADFTVPGRTEAVLARITDTDPEAAKAAVDLCVYRKLPGTESSLMALLASRRAQRPSEVAMKLAEVAETPQAVQAALPHLLRDRPEEYSQWTGFALEHALGHPDPAVSAPIRRALHKYTLQFQGKQRYDQSLVRDLAKTADRDAVPVLEDIYARAEDPVSRWYALEALARLHPEQAVDRILDCVRREGVREMLVDILREHVRGTDAGRVLPVVLHPFDEAGTSLPPAVVRLLLDRLGEPGRQAVEARLDRLDAHARWWALWKLRGLDLRSAVTDLHAAGVISLPPDEVLMGMRQPGEAGDEPRPLDLADPYALLGALAQAGLLTVFDAETGMVPCDHHRLILEFGEWSAGRFVPECPVQLWHQQGEEDYDAPYTVQFLYRGKLYSFGAENYGDWYDVEAVQNAINFALADAGRPERYLALESDGQMAQFVFADPAAFLPVAERYGLPLSGDPTAAMRKGKEYEQRLRESLG